MSISIKSRKAKARGLQDETRSQIISSLPTIGSEDVKCAIMGESGVDIHLIPGPENCSPSGSNARRRKPSISGRRSSRRGSMPRKRS